MLRKENSKMGLKGAGVAALQGQLLDLIREGRWPLMEPLPVTRFLGDSFGVSNVSAFRVLNELNASGHLWRAANGRYFLPEARRLLQKPAPVACLMRRLEWWTQVGREIMLGADDACGELDRAMLLVHDRVLFHQADPNAVTSAGSAKEIRQSMEDFLLVHSERISGVVLDELWPDRVLAGLRSRIKRGVVLYRSTRLPFLGCVSADSDSAARMVVAHARASGFEKLWIMHPFRGYEPSDQMVQALQAAAKSSFGKLPVVMLDSPRAIRASLVKLRRQRHRTLLVATEDNAAAAVLDALLEDGCEVPHRIGLMTTMGSRIALERSITSAGFDFRLMGQEAVRMAVRGRLRQFAIPAVLSRRSTA